MNEPIQVVVEDRISSEFFEVIGRIMRLMFLACNTEIPSYLSDKVRGEIIVWYMCNRHINIDDLYKDLVSDMFFSVENKEDFDDQHAQICTMFEKMRSEFSTIEKSSPK